MVGEHGLFEPTDIIYIDKNIRYHKGMKLLRTNEIFNI